MRNIRKKMLIKRFLDNCISITDFSDYNAAYEDFSPGWSWIGGKRDTSDVEWSLWIPFMFGIFPWTVSQLVVSQILKYYSSSTVVSC